MKYCTSGNIAPLGIESFDRKVRQDIGKIGTARHVMHAIRIINEYGNFKGEDGFPKLLPGINLIYNLPSQTKKTHEINIYYLQKIISEGLLTRRLFYRNMTPSTGVSFGDGPISNAEYLQWFDEIKKLFVMPMQNRIFPNGTILKGFQEIIHRDGDSYLRTLGTCSIRVKIKDNILPDGKIYKIMVVGNSGYRQLDGEIIE